MTILSFEKFFKRRQRAKARAAGLLQGFKDWCADGNATLPEGWDSQRLEQGFADVLSESEASSEQRDDSP